MAAAAGEITAPTFRWWTNSLETPFVTIQKFFLFLKWFVLILFCLHDQYCGALLMSAVKVVDNTLTIMIASAVGGAIAALMGFMLLKNFTLYVLSKLEERKWVFATTWSFASNAAIFILFHRSMEWVWDVSLSCRACTVLTLSSPFFPPTPLQ